MQGGGEMKHFQYDEELDAAYIVFAEAEIDRVEEPAPGVQLEFDGSGRLIGVELRRVSMLAQQETI